MRNRITIEQPERIADEAGGADITWTVVATVWAEIQPISGREVFISDQLGGRVTHEVRLRHRPGITPKMRILYAGRAFDIRFVANLGERGEWIICSCEETTA